MCQQKQRIEEAIKLLERQLCRYDSMGVLNIHKSQTYRTFGKTIECLRGQAREEMVSLDVEISDEDFLVMAKVAHEKNMTFNEWIAETLREQVERMKNETYSSENS